VLAKDNGYARYVPDSVLRHLVTLSTSKLAARRQRVRDWTIPVGFWNAAPDDVSRRWIVLARPECSSDLTEGCDT
jgi:hypothetical protein